MIPITKSISANSLTLTPTSSLNISTTYTVSVHTNSISDLAGQWKSCYISKNAKTSIITYETAGVEYPGALEYECNLHGVTSVTCEVLEPHGTLSSDKLNKSYIEMIALLTYYHIL